MGSFFKNHVFLGGTCNGSTWREELIPKLTKDYFNPVVDDWNNEAQVKEELHRKIDDYVLYTITPKMTGVYSIAEVVDDSNKRPDRTLLCILEKDGDSEFTAHQKKSLQAVAKLVTENGANCFYNLDDVAKFLNS